MAAQIQSREVEVDDLQPLIIHDDSLVTIALKIDEQLRERLEIEGIDRVAKLNARRFLRMALNEVILVNAENLEALNEEGLQEALIGISIQAVKEGLLNNGCPRTVNLIFKEEPKDNSAVTTKKIVKLVASTSIVTLVHGVYNLNRRVVTGSLIVLAACKLYEKIEKNLR